MLSSAALKRIAKEIQKLQQTPPEDIQIIINDENLTEIQAWIRGPDGTPYEGGYFKVKLVLEESFPDTPPKGYFMTKIFHPNVSPAGEICVNTLKKDWKAELGIEHVFLAVKCLLIVPNPESALNEEAGKLLLEQYDDYAKRAKLYASIQAKAGRVEFMTLYKERSAAENDTTTTNTTTTTTTSNTTTSNTENEGNTTLQTSVTTDDKKTKSNPTATTNTNSPVILNTSPGSPLDNNTVLKPLSNTPPTALSAAATATIELANTNNKKRSFPSDESNITNTADQEQERRLYQDVAAKKHVKKNDKKKTLRRL